MENLTIPFRYIKTCISAYHESFPNMPWDWPHLSLSVSDWNPSMKADLQSSLLKALRINEACLTWAANISLSNGDTSNCRHKSTYSIISKSELNSCMNWPKNPLPCSQQHYRPQHYDSNLFTFCFDVEGPFSYTPPTSSFSEESIKPLILGP